MPIGFNKTDIAKIFNPDRNLVAHWIKNRELTDVLKEPEDDNAILQILREVRQFHKTLAIIMPQVTS